MMLTGYELAKAFYDRYELEFVRVATAEDTKDRQFSFTPEQWDDFLVEQGVLTAAVRNANEELTRSGLLMARHSHRKKFNIAAKTDKRLPRNFSIEARGQRQNVRWRVVLLERYVAERPEHIARSFQSSLKFTDRSFMQAARYLEKQEHLPDDERLLIAAQLAHGRMQVFSLMNTAMLWVRSIEDGQVPDLRLLSRQFASLVNRTGKVQAVGKAARRANRRRGGQQALPA